MEIPHHLHLVHEFVVEEAREHHGDQQPLREGESRGTPEVRGVDVHRDSLTRHLRRDALQVLRS